MIRWALPGVFDASNPMGLIGLNGELTRQSLMIAYDSIFAWMALGLTLLFPIIFILRRPPAPVPMAVHEMAGD